MFNDVIDNGEYCVLKEVKIHLVNVGMSFKTQYSY